MIHCAFASRGLSQDEAYARLVELMIAAISSVTRRLAYTVDPQASSARQRWSFCLSSEGLLEYLKEKSDPWEWLAYRKLRAVGGDGTGQNDRNTRVIDSSERSEQLRRS